jgi:hypothetical protein
MSPKDADKLEAAIHRALRSVPDRKAPSGLEGRVLAELGRLSALPWWRRSFAHWPLAARVVFFAGSAVAAALVVNALIMVGLSNVAHDLAAGVGQRLAWISLARDITAAIGAKVRLVIGAIPAVWLYGAAVAVALCYATLAAIGAAAYRAVSFARQTSRI